MLKIFCGTGMTSKWVIIKMHNAFRRVCGDSNALEVFNSLWRAVASLAYICSLERTKANANHWHAKS